MANVLITQTIPGWSASWAVGNVVSVSDATATALITGGWGTLTSDAPTITIPTLADQLAALILSLPTALPDKAGVLWNNGGVPCVS